MNAEAWDTRGVDRRAFGRAQWSATEGNWGVFGIPESELGLLTGVFEGALVAELGCGTAYVSAWLARRGARPVAGDPSAGQLRLARGFQKEFGVVLPLVRAAGECVPLRSSSFDVVVSEYGAGLWADPHRWLPEAARLLCPGGELVFVVNSSLLLLCMPDSGEVRDHLLREHANVARVEWPGAAGVEFHLSHGDWVRALCHCGFEVEDLLELRAPAAPVRAPDFVPGEWARRWPAEDAWRARRSTH